MWKFAQQLGGLVAVALSACATSGVAPPRPIDLILVAGQSNAVGFDAPASALAPAPEDAEVLFRWRCGDPPPDSHDSMGGGEAWQSLRAQPRGQPIEESTDGTRPPRQYGNFRSPGGGFGPEIGVARWLLQADPERRLAICKVAFSGTSLSKDWSPDDPGPPGACYGALVEEARQALTLGSPDGRPIRVHALIWVQGESDAGPTLARGYAEALTEMIEQLRRDLDAPAMHAVLALNQNFGGGKNPSIPVVAAAQRSVAAADPLCRWVDTAAATTANNAHFNAAGTLDVGRWMGAALLALEAAHSGTK